MRKETNKLHTLRLNNDDKLDLQNDQLNNNAITTPTAAESVGLASPK